MCDIHGFVASKNLVPIIMTAAVAAVAATNCVCCRDPNKSRYFKYFDLMMMRREWCPASHIFREVIAKIRVDIFVIPDNCYTTTIYFLQGEDSQK